MFGLVVAGISHRPRLVCAAGSKAVFITGFRVFLSPLFHCIEQVVVVASAVFIAVKQGVFHVIPAHKHVIAKAYPNTRMPSAACAVMVMSPRPHHIAQSIAHQVIGV